MMKISFLKIKSSKLNFSYVNLKTILILASVFFLFSQFNDEKKAGNELSRIKYNNPELTVDLGVGLWAWPLPMDFDKDGILDLVVACTDKPHNGLYLFKKKAESEVFDPYQKIGAGVKNLQVSFVNGEPRVLGPGVEYRNFRTALFSDPIELFSVDSLEKDFKNIRFRQWKYVDYDGDNDLDLIVGIDEWGDYGWDNAFDVNGKWINGPLHGYIYLVENINNEYVNRGKLQAGGAIIDVYGAPTPNMEDFDGDGDLDLICGEFLDRLTYFENTGTRTNPKFDSGIFLENVDGTIKMDLEMIIPASIDWDNDGDIDLIVGDEDGRVAFIENSGQKYKSMPLFKSPVYLQQKADEVKFGALITPFSVDWDDDGDEDLICGNTAGYIGYIENLSGGINPKWNQPKRLKAEDEVIRILAGENGSIQGPAEQKWGYTTLSVEDWDNDGLKDIIVNSIWGKVVWFKNIGKKGNPRLAKAQPLLVDWPLNSIPPKPVWNWWNPLNNELSTQWRTTPQVVDWNKDGLMDLVMLDHEGILSFYERFEKDGKLMLLPGQRIFYGTNKKEIGEREQGENLDAGLLQNSRINGGSGRRKWCFSDWDKDGDLDILANSKNVALFRNDGEVDGIFQFSYQGDLSNSVLAGHTTSPTIVHWIGDDWPDLLLGAEDGFLYYLTNPNRK